MWVSWVALLLSSSVPPVVMGQASGLDATQTAIRLAGGQKLTELTHAPGMVPRGRYDPASQATWLVVADGPGRHGEPASLWRVADDGRSERVLTGIDPLQAPAVLQGGGAVVFSTDAERDFTVHTVDARGARFFKVRDAAWVVPVPGGRVVCVMVQEGMRHVLACEDGNHELGAAPLMRDPFLVGNQLWAVEAVSRGARVVDMALPSARRRTVATGADEGFSLVAAGGCAAWTEGAGRGLGLECARRSRRVQGPAQVMWVPLAMDGAGHHLVFREDSVDGLGHLDGRKTPRFGVLSLRTQKVAWLETAGITEVYGVRGP